MAQNAILSEGVTVPGDVAERIAQQTIAQRSDGRRGAAYADEVRRLLDAGLDLMRRSGTGARPRVSDIVAAAGLSNDAFYRHFPSKDALVAAIVEDGAVRLSSYLTHQMEKETTPERRVRRWVEGVLSQAADAEIAATTLAVLRNAGHGGGAFTARNPSIDPALATLLEEPYAALGSPAPPLDASLASHAVVGLMSDHLWRGTRPTRAEIDHVVAFCLAVPVPR
jgi:AcrR family transcriptional regulator